MAAYHDFARIFWTADSFSLTWATDCGAEPTRPFRYLADAARDLAGHFDTCETCQENANNLVDV